MTYEELQEAYNHARQWLYFLIDHPDKTVSVAEYRDQLKAARKASDTAHRALLAACE